MRPARPSVSMAPAPAAADHSSKPSESDETDGWGAGSDTGPLVRELSSGPRPSVVATEPLNAARAGSGAGACRSGARRSATAWVAGTCGLRSTFAYPGEAAITAMASAAVSTARPATRLKVRRLYGGCISCSLTLRARFRQSVGGSCLGPVADRLRAGCVAPRAPGEDAWAMDFRVLGPVEVWSDGRRLDLGGRRRRGLLALLLLHAGEAVPAERLIEDLWGDEAATISAKTLHAHVSRLRAALGAGGDAAGAGRIATTSAGYRVVLEPGELDVRRFEELCAEGRR